MAEFIKQARVSVELTLKLTEEEARALNALTIYGDDAFLEVFKKCLGKTEIEKYESGLLSLFQSTRETLPKVFNQIDDARCAFRGQPRKDRQ